MKKSDYMKDNHALCCEICQSTLNTNYTLDPIFLAFYREYDVDKYEAVLSECRRKGQPRWICKECYDKLEG